MPDSIIKGSSAGIIFIKPKLQAGQGKGKAFQRVCQKQGSQYKEHKGKDKSLDIFQGNLHAAVSLTE